MAIKFNKLTTVLALASVVTSLLPVAASAAEVNIYSSRKEALIKPLLDQFSEKTGIEVNLLTGNSDALLARLKSEGEYTAADLFLTVDAGALHRAVSADVFQTVSSAKINAIVPEHFRSSDDHWVGLSLRARPIFYFAGARRSGRTQRLSVTGRRKMERPHLHPFIEQPL